MNAIRLKFWLLLIYAMSGLCEPIQAATYTIKVVGTNGHPLRCESWIWILSSEGKRDKLGRTARGVQITQSAYASGDVIQVRPEDEFFYSNHDHTECPLNVETVVTIKEASVEARTIKVIDDDGSPVAANVWLESETGSRIHLGATRDGEFVMSVPSAGKDLLRAVPVSKQTYFEDARTSKWLAGAKEFKITSDGVWSKLQQSAEASKSRGQNGEAALIYQEMAARAKGFNRTQAYQYESKCYEMLGRHFQIKGSAASRGPGGKPRMSVELQKKVVTYQKARGLRATGVLDYKTMEKIAGVSIGKHINK